MFVSRFKYSFFSINGSETIKSSVKAEVEGFSVQNISDNEALEDAF